MGCQASKNLATAVGEHATATADELSYFSTTNILRSSLVAAMRTRDAALVDAILTKKPFLRHNKIDDVSLVLSSCTDESVELLRVLLHHGASADDGIQDGFSALHLAVVTNQVRVVELLVANGADVNAPTRTPQQPLDGMTPLHLAARRGRVEVAQALLASGRVDLSAVDDHGFTAVQTAVARPAGLPVFRLLHSLELVENVSSYSMMRSCDVPLLVLAVRPQNLATVEYLIQHGERDGIVNVAAPSSGVTPLMVAAAEGLLDIVELLITNGAKVNALRTSEPIHSTALFEAAFEGHHEVVATLLHSGARHDIRTGDNGMTPLHAAASHGHVRSVKLLCDAGANVNRPSCHCAPHSHSGDDKLTPVHMAAFDGHVQVVDVLATHGANVDTPSARGETPLLLAATHGHASLVRHLLEKYGVDVHHCDESGSNALHKAVAMGHADTARVLLEHGVDANGALLYTKQAPLHIAAAAGHGEAIRVLLAFGADPNVANDHGKTPEHIALAHGHSEVLHVLKTRQGTDVSAVPG